MLLVTGYHPRKIRDLFYIPSIFNSLLKLSQAYIDQYTYRL